MTMTWIERLMALAEVESHKAHADNSKPPKARTFGKITDGETNDKKQSRT